MKVMSPVFIRYPPEMSYAPPRSRLQGSRRPAFLGSSPIIDRIKRHQPHPATPPCGVKPGVVRSVLQQRPRGRSSNGRTPFARSDTRESRLTVQGIGTARAPSMAALLRSVVGAGRCLASSCVPAFQGFRGATRSILPAAAAAVQHHAVQTRAFGHVVGSCSRPVPGVFGGLGPTSTAAAAAPRAAIPSAEHARSASAPLLLLLLLPHPFRTGLSRSPSGRR